LCHLVAIWVVRRFFIHNFIHLAFGMLPVKCNTNSKVQSIKLSTPNLIIDLGYHFTFIVGLRIINLEPIPQQLEMIIELDIDLLQKIEPRA
jgi:hypothetical protein